MSEEDRIAGRGEKSGVFTGGYAINPGNGERIPVWIADYVLISYGTGAIMAVPGHDERDFEFAKKFSLKVRAVVMPPDDWLRDMVSQYAIQRAQSDTRLDQLPISEAEEAEIRRNLAERVRLTMAAMDSRQMQAARADYRLRVAEWPAAFTGDGHSIQSANEELSLDGQPSPEAKKTITAWLASVGLGRASVKYKLRDWLFSRQRYWGEPFPVLHEVDEQGRATGLTRAVPADQLPVRLPELDDYKPSGNPEPPLEKASDWVWVTESGGRRAEGGEPEEQGRGQAVPPVSSGPPTSALRALPRFKRETNTMPQWAGSCWYYLRFCDPRNDHRAWDPANERYWMPVDLYVGGAEHAVLHLLYSRFWHKVLFDRGHVSTMEPFQRLVNQGMILSVTYRSSDDRIIPYTKINFGEGKAQHAETGEELTGQTEKMSKARGNVIPVDVPVNQYGADCTRMYEMFMGPLEVTKPWSMQGVEGISRFLNRAWRMVIDEDAEEMRLNAAITDAAPTEEQLRVMHKTIQVVTEDLEALRFNTAISRLMEFVNYFTGQPVRPRACVEPFVLLLAPLAPHLAEELWQALGHSSSLAYAPWPTFDPNLTREDRLELPVQINGKLRGRIVVAAEATTEELERAALADTKVQAQLAGKKVKKVIVVPGKLVNIVVQ